MGDTERLVQKNEEVVDVSKLSPEDMKKVQEIAKQIDIDDSQAVVTYGVGAQREISSFSDTILNEVRTKDTGFVGDILTNLVVNIKDLDVDSLSTGGSFVSKIPVIGQLVDSVKRFIIRYEKTSLQIEKITDELDKARMQLLKDIALLDNMYEKNQEYLKNLDLYIAAGQIKLKELQEKTIPEMKAKADASNDPADAQKFQDLAMAVNCFEKKVHDMKLSRMIAIQTAPQVRMIQGSNQTLVEKIQTSILNTIPLWKNQIVIAITLFRQNKALKLQKEITKTTNDLLSKNAELLKQSSIDIAKETERGIVDIETLKKVNNDLITTIEETLKIQAEGRVKRAQAEKELIKLETDLKQKLTTVKESK